MTLALERPDTSTAPAVSLDAWSMHHTIQAELRTIDAATERRLGIVATELVEVVVSGRHRLLVLDESQQPGGAFKYNGMAYAVDHILTERPETETFYMWSAGNAGGTAALAAANHGRRTVVLSPRSISESKRRAIQRHGGVVVATHDTSEDGLKEAESLARTDQNGVFLHAFNNFYALAGQGLVARRIVNGLQALDIDGPIEVLGQRGGGSLLASMASVFKAANIVDLRVHEVRPERKSSGTLNPLFDGLAVDEPGSLAAPLIRHDSFVADTIHITEAEAGLAALRLARYRQFMGRRFEPSGVVGVAAFEQMAMRNPVPTTYVAVLSGANVDAKTYAELVDAPRRFQEQLFRGLGRTDSSETDTAVPSLVFTVPRTTRVASGAFTR